MPSAPFARGWRSLRQCRSFAPTPVHPCEPMSGLPAAWPSSGISPGPPAARAALGEPSKLAAGLLSRAPADAVLIAASTRQLVRGLFEQHALGPVLAEGFAQPIEAWRVSDANATASRFLALRAPELSPLVGRDEELDLLSRRWEQAKAGRGRIVLVGGEPGIGKSRLLHAFEQGLSGDDAIIMRHFCSPHHADSAFLPIIEQLERAAGFSRADSATQKLAKLEALLATSGVSDEQIGLIASLLAIRADGRMDPRPVAAATQGQDVGGTACASFRPRRAAARARDLRGCTLDRSELARTAVAHDRAYRAPPGFGAGHGPPRVSAALGGGSAPDDLDIGTARSA